MGPRLAKVMASLAIVLVCCACGAAPTKTHATGDPAALQAAFTTGLDDFCRAYYEGQRTTDERYPTTQFAPQYDAAMQAQTRRADAMLARLHPPAAMAPTFARFVKNERVLYRSLVAATARAAKGGDAVAGPAFGNAVDRRHELAGSLGARECDGLLPRAQRRAVVAALKHWDVTRDWHQACVDLVTKEYAHTRWMESVDPTAACRQAFAVRHSGAFPVPEGISVSSVSGVEDLSATVHFTEVPDCGCGNLIGRLYFEGRRWLVRNAYAE